MTDIPTLDALAADPTKAAALPALMALDLLARLAALQPVLLARCVAGTGGPGPSAPPDPPPAYPEQPDAPLLTAADAAKLLALGEWRVYELARQGRLPVVRIGKNVRFRKSDLLAWIERHREK